MHVALLPRAALNCPAAHFAHLRSAYFCGAADCRYPTSHVEMSLHSRLWNLPAFFEIHCCFRSQSRCFVHSRSCLTPARFETKCVVPVDEPSRSQVACFVHFRFWYAM